MRQGATTKAGSIRRHARAARPTLHRARMPRLAALALTLVLVLTVPGCDSSAGPVASPGETGAGETSGPAFERADLALSPFDAQAAVQENGASIDVSNASSGYVAVAATSQNRLKFQIVSENYEYYYDLPNDGSPLSCPLSAGDGTYSLTVWENTSGNRYVELASVLNLDVNLTDEFQPFVRPSVYCNYDASSASTKLANDLCADAQNEGDVVRAVFEWIVENIAYDEEKAASLADATGYIPSPDATISEGTGICFDYASLAAAMLRSQGIPCKIVTGNVSPDDIYHAWNMVYIDGTWIGAGIDVEQNTWTRIDTTFAAGSGSNYVGDGTSYTDRYTY